MNKLTKHTPGPLELWTGCSWRRFGSKTTGETVCEPTVLHDGQADLYFRNGGQSGPDAKRLVACWNACEGINPEAVPELLRAAKLADKRLASGGDLLFDGNTRGLIRAAIAKAEE